MRTISLGLLFSLQVFAGSAATLKAVSKQSEAIDLLSQIITGAVNPNTGTNRLKYLGQEKFAAHELANQFFKELDVERKRIVVQVLAGLGSREGEDAMVAALSDPDATVRMYAAQGVGRIKSREAGPRLQAMLLDQTLGVRRDAARSIGMLADPRYGAAVARAAKAEDDPESRAVMLLATGQTGDKKQTAMLEGFLNHSSESTRFAAAAGLCVLGAAAGQKFAKAMLASKDRYQRMQGLMLFEGSRAKESSATLEPLLKDDDRSLQAAAARILYQGGDKSKLDWLVLHSFQSLGEERLPYENELETLRLTDDDRRAILRKAGIK